MKKKPDVTANITVRHKIYTNAVNNTKKQYQAVLFQDHVVDARGDG